jgi:uncharacterized protein YjbJ (UPF0337 family)
MGRRKRSASGDPLDKAVGRLVETTGTMSGDRTLEVEGRATRRMGERKTYVVTTHANGGWKVQVEGASRATSVHKTKGEAVANAKELARSHQPSQLLVYKQNGTVQTEQTYG